MLIAHISAPNDIRKLGAGPLEMVIAPWLLEYKGYHDWYAIYPPKSRIILDNGAFEGQMVSTRSMAILAKEIEANTVVLPDVLYNGQETLAEARRFVAEFDYPIRNMMFVPQGSSIVEWGRCINEFVEWWERQHRYCSLQIGVVQIRPEKIKGPIPFHRWEVIGSALSFGYEVHLLGLPNVQDFIERELVYREMVSSLDTSLAYATAALGQVLMPNTPKPIMGDVSKYANVKPHLVRVNRTILNSWVRAGSAKFRWTSWSELATAGHPADYETIRSHPEILNGSIPAGMYQVSEKGIRPYLAGSIVGTFVEVR